MPGIDDGVLLGVGCALLDDIEIGDGAAMGETLWRPNRCYLGAWPLVSCEDKGSEARKVKLLD